MATGKRFYWMKLKESFMTSDTIDYFMSQPDGANYVVLYQMLCLKTINTDGRLSRQIGEVVIKYDIPKIQRDLKWFSADTIRVALNLYKSFGLVYEKMGKAQPAYGCFSGGAGSARRAGSCNRNAAAGSRTGSDFLCNPAEI